MPGTTERIRQLWERVRKRDPYWDDFLHRPPADPRNVIAPVILDAPGGSRFPNITEIHDPSAMSGHLKELAKFFGADVTGVSAIRVESRDSGEESYTFAVSCLVAAVEEPSQGAGVGGQFALQKSATVNFNVAAYIRELGYQATVDTDSSKGHAYAAAAGLGKLDADGRLNASKYGRRVAVAGVVFTTYRSRRTCPRTRPLIQEREALGLHYAVCHRSAVHRGEERRLRRGLSGRLHSYDTRGAAALYRP